MIKIYGQLYINVVDLKTVFGAYSACGYHCSYLELLQQFFRKQRPQFPSEYWSEARLCDVGAIDWVMGQTTNQERGIWWTLLTPLEDLDIADNLALVSHTYNHV